MSVTSDNEENLMLIIDIESYENVTTINPLTPDIH